MAIQQNFPSTRPSLNLNFARSKTLDPRITFTRTSSATYVDENGLVKIAPANEARFDHDLVTGESLGLLIEEQRENFLTYSEEYQNAVVFRGEVTPNATLSPDGNQTADLFLETIEDGNHIVQSTSSYNFTSGITYTYSVFIKPNGRDYIRIRANNTTTLGAETYFNLTGSGSTGSIVTGSASVIPYPNGWYRCIITGVSGQTSTTGFQHHSSSSVGDITKGFYIWGSQLEEGSFPTSYIPTSGSTATRTPDNASITGSNFSSWYNPNEGTIFCSANNNPGITTSTSRIFYDFRNSASGDFIRKWIWNENTGLLLNSIYTSDGGPIAAEFSTSLETGNKKTAISYKQNDFARSYNGSVPLTDGGGNTPVGVNELQIGTDLSGYISQLIYYPSRLPNTTLQTLTK